MTITEICVVMVVFLLLEHMVVPFLKGFCKGVAK